MWPSGDWSYPDPLSQPGAAPDAAPFHVCRFNEAWLAVIVGSLERLKVAEFWEGDTAAVAETLQQIDECLNQLATEYTPPTMTLPVGMISPYSGPTAPEGWLICDGSAVSRAAYPDLFTVCGTTYGAGDGTTTFNLPDLRTRAPIGASDTTGGGAIIERGVMVGSAFSTLSVANLPAHSHNLDASTGRDLYVYSGSGSGRYGISEGSGLNTVATRLTTEATGSGTQFSLMQPSIGLNFIIYAG